MNPQATHKTIGVQSDDNLSNQRISYGGLSRQPDCDSMHSTHTSYRRLLSPLQIRQRLSSRLVSPQPQPTGSSRLIPSLIFPPSTLTPTLTAPFTSRKPLLTQRQHSNSNSSRDKSVSSSKRKDQFLEKPSTKSPEPLKNLESALSKLEMKIEQARKELEKRNANRKQEPEEEMKRRKSQSVLEKGESTITVKKIPGGEGTLSQKISPPVKQKIYYVSQAERQKHWKLSPIKDHIRLAIQMLRRLQDEQPPELPFPHQPPSYRPLKTIVFQLDQTLLYCNSQNKVCDARIYCKNRLLQLNIRPYALRMLSQLSSYFQIISFTTRQRVSADAILNFLDPEKKIFRLRLYEQHCYRTQDGDYVKDLRILGRRLEDVVLVDCSASSFAFQIENGVPIIPYKQGSQDMELKYLTEYLMTLCTTPDIQDINRRTFKLQHYSKFRSPQQLIQELYSS